MEMNRKMREVCLGELEWLELEHGGRRSRSSLLRMSSGCLARRGGWDRPGHVHARRWLSAPHETLEMHHDSCRYKLSDTQLDTCTRSRACQHYQLGQAIFRFGIISSCSKRFEWTLSYLPKCTANTVAPLGAAVDR
jgi:hypothetical protein